MAAIYNISASYIGEAMENQNFLIYHTECNGDGYLVQSGSTTIFSSASLASGIQLTLDEGIQTLYLVPLAPECPLGCGYNYSIDLSGFVAVSPTPSVTPTVTPTRTFLPVSVIPSQVATVTPTLTPSPTTIVPWAGPFGLHTISRNGEQLRCVWSADDYSSWQRNIYAYNLASYLTKGTPPGQSTSETSPITATLDMDFYVYNNARTTIKADVERLFGQSPVVYYFADVNSTTLVADNVSVLNFGGGKDNFYYIDKDDI